MLCQLVVRNISLKRIGSSYIRVRLGLGRRDNGTVQWTTALGGLVAAGS